MTALTLQPGEPATSSNGTLPARGGTMGDMVVSQLHGRYYEQALNGHLFYAQTAVTGVAPGTAISTTGAYTLYNPIGSGYNLVVLEGMMGYVSGTIGAGVVDWVAHVNPAAAAPTGTAIVATNALLGGSAGVARPLTTSTVVAGTPIRPFCSLGASLATTAVQPWHVRDDVGGAIIVAPGCAVDLHATAAGGTSPLVVFGVLWEEVAI